MKITTTKKLETFSSKRKHLETEEMTHQKHKNWTGVPTKKNPNLLVCFSPAQQDTVVKTSADNLLDLHKKFINRRGYYHEHAQSISPPKYFIDVSPLEVSKITEQYARDVTNSNRLLNIIKENSNPAKGKSNGFVPYSAANGKEKVVSQGESQERSRVTKLSDWLNLARRAPPIDNATRMASGDVLIEHRLHEAKQQHSECADKTQNCQSSQDVVRRTKRVNGALIDAAAALPQRNSTPTLHKSPVSFNSAIIDKSSCSPLENKRSATVIGRAVGAGIDPWYVNPALIIEDKPEVPPKVKRIVTVDRDYIDTRSIFDQGPTVTRKKNMDNVETMKQVTAAEIMENLKQLQAGMKDQMNKQRRCSMPEEYFDRQLKYIERLENQLKDVIIAEEEEQKATEEFERKRNKTRPYSVSESSFPEKFFYKLPSQESGNEKSKNDECVSHKDQWKESSKKTEGENSEYENKEGSREFKKEVKNEKGFYSETSSEKIEEIKEHTVTTKSIINKDSPKESKLKDFLKDLNDPILDKVSSLKSNKSSSANDSEKQERVQKRDTERPKIDRPVSIATIPTNGEVFRKQMYDEYVHKVLEREERKHHKVIKISSHADIPMKKTNKRHEDYSCLNKVEQEFIEKAKNRLSKFGIKLDESETEGTSSGNEIANPKQQQQQQQVETKFLVDGREVKDARSLPKHLQEFLRLSAAKEDDEEEEKDGQLNKYS